MNKIDDNAEKNTSPWLCKISLILLTSFFVIDEEVIGMKVAFQKYRLDQCDKHTFIIKFSNRAKQRKTHFQLCF